MKGMALAVLKDLGMMRGDEAFAAILLTLAITLGGSPGTVLDLLLAIPAVLYLALRWRGCPANRWARSVPWLVIGWPLLQLVPLPPQVFAVLPGRGELVRLAAESGVAFGWHPYTLDAFATERVVLSLLPPLAMYWAVLRLERPAQRRLLALALSLALISALIGFSQVVGGVESSLYFYDSTNFTEAVGFFANRNHQAALLYVMVPVAAGLLSDRLRRTRRLLDPSALLYVIALVFAGIGVTVTHSRMGFVLLIVAIIAGTLLLLPGANAQEEEQARVARWMRWALLIGAVVAIQYELVALLARLQADPLEDLRWTLLRHTLDAARIYGGWGAGFGVFPNGYYRLGEAAADIDGIVNHAHNDWAELWFEGGWYAVALAALLVVTAGYFLIRRLLEAMREANDLRNQEETGAGSARRRRTTTRGLIVGAGLIPVLLALHSFVDYPLRTEALAVLAALGLAVVYGNGRRDPLRDTGLGSTPA